MSLRPRYSLLTLLILTALVAGGVKLWYGPHHVVERIPAEKGTWLYADREAEYAYTNNWSRERVIHGPRIERWFEHGTGENERVLLAINIYYYRHGSKMRESYLLCYMYNYKTKIADVTEKEPVFFSEQLEESPFTLEERTELRQAIRRERVKLQPRAGDYFIMEYFNGKL